MTARKCPGCKKKKDVSLFYRDKNRTCGVGSYCKACIKVKYGGAVRKSAYKKKEFPERNCFRCGINYKPHYNVKYCSKKCRYEAQGDRMQFQCERGPNAYDGRPKSAPFLK